MICVQVFKGKVDKTHDLVAIKMLAKSIINSDEYLREGLLSEIKIMQKLKQKNVVQLLDVLETANNYYIIQEFCNEGDFSQFSICFNLFTQLLEEEKVVART